MNPDQAAQLAEIEQQLADVLAAGARLHARVLALIELATAEPPPAAPATPHPANVIDLAERRRATT